MDPVLARARQARNSQYSIHIACSTDAREIACVGRARSFPDGGAWNEMGFWIAHEGTGSLADP